MQDDPTPETLNALSRLSRSASDPALQGGATLALGGAARRSSGQPELEESSERAVADLVRGANTATTPQGRRLYLGALGNAGSPEALPAIQQALADDSGDIRATAMNALRHIPGPEADASIARALRSDPDVMVRLSAVSVAERRPMTSVIAAAADVALRSDTAINVRGAVAGLIGNKLADAPALQTTLEWAMANDRVEDVRKAAARALELALARAVAGDASDQEG
jgi:HEAT repeat protein